MKYALLITTLLVLAVFSSVAPAASSSSDFVLGVCTHFGHGNRDVSKSLGRARQLGFASVRDEFLWSHVETRRGQFEIRESDSYISDVSRAGMKTLIVLGYGNNFYGERRKPLSNEQLDAFERYIRFVVSTFKGKVWAYEIWNEYDGKAGGYNEGTAEDYASLVNRMSRVVRSEDPRALIFAGSFTPKAIVSGWADAFLRRLDLAVVDGVSVHPYSQGRAARADEVAYSLALVRSVEKSASAASDHQGVLTPAIYVTEIGWQTAEGISEAEASTRIREFIAEIRRIPLVRGLWVYELENSGLNPRDGEHNYGVYTRGLERQRYLNIH